MKLGFVRFLSLWVCCVAVSALSVQAQNAPSANRQAAAAKANAQAQSDDPAEVIKAATENVLSIMRNNEALYHENPEQLSRAVEKSVLPYLNVARMAQLSMGPHWKLADQTQRTTIIREFQTYLIHAYINTLFLYRNTKLELVSRDDKAKDKTLLKTRVKNEQGKAVNLFLRVEKDDDQWQILDVNVEGVSLITTAKDLFDDEIKKTGVSGFIESLIQQNKKASFGDK